MNFFRPVNLSRRERVLQALRFFVFVLALSYPVISLIYTYWGNFDPLNFSIVEGVLGIVGLISILYFVSNYLISKKQLICAVVGLFLCDLYAIMRLVDDKILKSNQKYEPGT